MLKTQRSKRIKEIGLRCKKTKTSHLLKILVGEPSCYRLLCDPSEHQLYIPGVLREEGVLSASKRRQLHQCESSLCLY